MTSLTLSLIITLSLFIQNAASQSELIGLNGETFDRSSYIAINSFLVKGTSRINLREHLIKPINYLRAHRTQMSANEINAWELYTALEKLMKADSCDWTSYQILRKNAVASELGEERKSKEEPKVRLKFVVQNLAKRHAETCAPVYSQIYKKIAAERVDPKDLAMIDDLSFFSASALEQPDVAINLFWPGFAPSEEFFRLVKEADVHKMVLAIDKTISASANPEVALLLVGHYDEKLGKTTYDRNSIVEFVQKLFNKCDTHLKEFGSLYEMAAFDAETNNFPIYGTPELSRGWVNFNVCKNLVQRNPDVLADALVEYIGTFGKSK